VGMLIQNMREGKDLTIEKRGGEEKSSAKTGKKGIRKGPSH